MVVPPQGASVMFAAQGLGLRVLGLRGSRLFGVFPKPYLKVHG